MVKQRQVGRSVVISSPGFRLVRLATALVLPLLILAACGQAQSPSSSPTPPATQVLLATATTISEPSATTVPPLPLSTRATVTGYPIKVYFSKFPDSQSNFGAVFPVDRISPSLAVGTWAIQMLIAGPIPTEWNNGYFSELNSLLTGPSTCSAPRPTGGPDFTLTLNVKGSKAEQGTATLKFCRATMSPGIGADARIQAEISTTLQQFPSIKKVVILTKDGHCFGDQSGRDLCLK